MIEFEVKNAIVRFDGDTLEIFPDSNPSVRYHRAHIQSVAVGKYLAYDDMLMIDNRYSESWNVQLEIDDAQRPVVEQAIAEINSALGVA